MVLFLIKNEKLIYCYQSYSSYYIKAFHCGGDIFTELDLVAVAIKHKMDGIWEMLLYGIKTVSVLTL